MSASPQSDHDLTIDGWHYSGSDSDKRPARLCLAAGRFVLETAGSERSLHWYEVEVAPRIGNTPRYLYLPGNAVFETHDNEGVDALAKRFRHGRMAQWIHRLENHLGLILVACVVTLLVTVLTFTHGIPRFSSLVANALPDHVSRQLGADTLEQLDQFWLEPSTLSAKRQRALHEHFAPLLATEPGHEFNVKFRSGEVIGANAMALPDGTIIFTDQLVELAESPDELAAILAHEMGHVIERHGLQGLVQSSLVGWAIVLMTGDLSASSELVVIAPAVLMDLSYSRRMEREADAFALQRMLDEGLDPAHFANIMLRLEASHEDKRDHKEDEGKERGWSERLGGALSTHPLTDERIQRFREAGRE